jgi:hypothetical protein
MELKDEAAWKEYERTNTDPYGKGCVDYARAWAGAMEARLTEGANLEDIADATSQAVNKRSEFGITGFMYGCAVSMLAQCWQHGEALRRWHNLKTQLGTEGERANESGGVLNPALLQERQ